TRCQRDGRERSQLELFRDSSTRHDRHADSGFDHAFYLFRTAKLHHDIEVFRRHSRLPEIIVRELARAGTAFAANVRLAGELLRRDGREPGKLVTRRAYHEELVVTADFSMQARQARW